MWQQSRAAPSSEGNVTESSDDTKAWTKEFHDSSHVDSGFLSGGNLQISTELTSATDFEVRPEASEPAIAPEPMRTDSGLDLGLSESLGALTLQHVTLNPLASGKIHGEPTAADLVPVSREIRPEDDGDGNDGKSNRTSVRPAGINDESWQLYYTQDDDGDTQLHLAIVQGFLEAAFSLIRMAPYPCLLNTLNNDWQSPLHLAVLTRQPRIVRQLILAGADPTVRNFCGNTALHLACRTGDLGCAKALTDPLSPGERNYLSAGKKVPALPQNLEQRNYNGEMCLHVAASQGHVDLVRLLLRLGADLEAREGLSGRTALHLAMEHGRRSVLAFLLQECRPCLDTPTYAGLTAYQFALCFDRQLARELVRFGATPQPLPETDEESSDDEDAMTSSYAPTLSRLQQNAVGVRV